MTRDEANEVSRMLEEASVDSIEFSGGTVVSQEFIPPRPGKLKNLENEVYYRETAVRPNAFPVTHASGRLLPEMEFTAWPWANDVKHREKDTITLIE